MLSSFGIRAYRNLLRKFFSVGFQQLTLDWGNDTLWGRLWKWEGSVACTMGGGAVRFYHYLIMG